MSDISADIIEGISAELQGMFIASPYQRVWRCIKEIASEHTPLLKEKEVIMWLFSELSFLPSIEKKNKTADTKRYKELEDIWGREILKKRRPDLKLDKQWSGKFGEYVCEEILRLLGKMPHKPIKIQHYQPDYEVDDAIWEAKTETFYTEGTAGEKILGCPFKYAEIPELYAKPLRILCIGGAEKACREQYGNLKGSKCSSRKNTFLQFYKDIGIEYVGATDLLCQIADVPNTN
jgi:hypothetical protein